MTFLSVVYVDDEVELCSLFEELFGSPEVRVSSFSDPFVALERINQMVPDVVFLDYRMPGMNGIEMAERILEAVPIYMITGEVLPPQHPAIKMVLRKPYGTAQVHEILGALLRDKLNVAG